MISKRFPLMYSSPSFWAKKRGFRFYATMPTPVIHTKAVNIIMILR